MFVEWNVHDIIASAFAPHFCGVISVSCNMYLQL